MTLEEFLCRLQLCETLEALDVLSNEFNSTIVNGDIHCDPAIASKIESWKPELYRPEIIVQGGLLYVYQHSLPVGGPFYERSEAERLVRMIGIGIPLTPIASDSW